MVAYLRQQDVRLTAFVDDFMQMAQESLSVQHKQLTLDTLERLGLTINWEKSQLHQSKVKVFVGFNVHITGVQGPWIQVTAGKLGKLR